MGGGRRLPSALADLAALRSPDGRGLHASAGASFAGSLFGRDACEAAEDLLDVDPGVAAETIVALAELQGRRDTPAGPRSNEEERGKIVHQHATAVVGGVPIPSERLAELRANAAKWGTLRDEIRYYGSVDATPLFARLVAAYCDRVPGGDAILGHRLSDGRTVADALGEAVSWIERRIAASDLGLLEYRRRNPQGLEHQWWTDSQTGVIHPDGTPADHRQPIAVAAVQGLAYDALTGAARVLARSRPADASRWRRAAEGLRERTLAAFWMADVRYFATAIDRDPQGRPRRVRTLSASPATLLDTGLLEGLDAARRGTYVDGVVRMILGPEFLTDVGIRCRGVSHHDVVPFADYHGSWAVWFKETYDVARGLRRHGFDRVATELENRILNGVNVCGDDLEFLFVAPDGRVDYDPLERRPAASRTTIASTDVPDAAQAWTVSAVLAIKRRHGRRAPDSAVARPPALRRLEREVLAAMPGARLLTRLAEIERARAAATPFHVDVGLGRAAQAAVRAGFGRRPGPPADLAQGRGRTL